MALVELETHSPWPYMLCTFVILPSVCYTAVCASLCVCLHLISYGVDVDFHNLVCVRHWHAFELASRRVNNSTSGGVRTPLQPGYKVSARTHMYVSSRLSVCRELTLSRLERRMSAHHGASPISNYARRVLRCIETALPWHPGERCSTVHWASVLAKDGDLSL